MAKLHFAHCARTGTRIQYIATENIELKRTRKHQLRFRAVPHTAISFRTLVNGGIMRQIYVSSYARLRTQRTLATVFFCATLAAGSAAAKTLCVTASATPGCFSTIGAAVAAASPGDTIQVAHGTYKEDVTIPISLLLIGENEA